MNRRTMLILSIVITIVGILITASGYGAGKDLSMGKVSLGYLITCFGLGNALGMSRVVAGICLALSIIVTATAGISVGTVLLCCIPATVLVLHSIKGTGTH